MEQINKDKVFVDIETSGLSAREGAEIIRIEAIKVFGGEIKDRFFTYVSPERPVIDAVTSLTGIDEKTLKGAPDIKTALTRFGQFVEDCAIIGYELPFAMEFLNYYGNKYGIKFDNRSLDLYPIIRMMLDKRIKNFHLETVGKFFVIDAKSEPEIMFRLTRLQCYIDNEFYNDYMQYIVPALRELNGGEKECGER